jgi:hypothetical protein
MLMIWEPDVNWDAEPADHLADAMRWHGEFAQFLQDRGIEYSSNALRHGSEARTLRRQAPIEDWVRKPLLDGQTLVTDGPYIELKEQFGGFYIIDVKDMDEAIDVAKRLPTFMATEIRPIWSPRDAVAERSAQPA